MGPNGRKNGWDASGAKFNSFVWMKVDNVNDKAGTDASGGEFYVPAYFTRKI